VAKCHNNGKELMDKEFKRKFWSGVGVAVIVIAIIFKYVKD
jgi:hypothetical protein